jgi:hypothetical protein
VVVTDNIIVMFTGEVTHKGVFVIVSLIFNLLVRRSCQIFFISLDLTLYFRGHNCCGIKAQSLSLSKPPSRSYVVTDTRLGLILLLLLNFLNCHSHCYLQCLHYTHRCHRTYQCYCLYYCHFKWHCQ